MEYPKKVVGWAKVPHKSNPDKYSYRLSCVADMKPGPDCEGVEVFRDFYNPERVGYTPCIGDLIITVEGRYGIDRIIKVG